MKGGYRLVRDQIAEQKLETALLNHEARLQNHMKDALKQAKYYYELFLDEQNSFPPIVVSSQKMSFKPDQLNFLYYSFTSAVESPKFPIKNRLYTRNRFLVIKNVSKFIYNLPNTEATEILYFHIYNLESKKFKMLKAFNGLILENTLFLPLINRDIEKNIREGDWVFISKREYEDYNELRKNLMSDNHFSENYLAYGYEIDSITKEEITELANSNQIFLFEKILKDDGGTYYSLLGNSEIYQYQFQLNGLKRFKDDLNEHHAAQKEYMLQQTHHSNREQNPVDKGNPKLSDELLQIKQWDSDQIEALKLFIDAKPLIVLNGFVGTGKTEVITTFLAQLKEKKAIFLAHDHSIVEFLFDKYHKANPDNIALRIGNQKKAKQSNYHIKSEMTGLQTDILKKLDRRITEKQTLSAQKDILIEWKNFLEKPEGLEILGKLKFNSANALFCTVNGLEYYIKKQWLDEFLPFDYLLVDEASMTDLSMVFHTTQFCLSNIIAGDKYLIPPRTPDWDNRQNFIQDIDAIFSEKKRQFIVSFKTEYRMAEPIFNALNTHIWNNENAECKTDKSKLFCTRSNKNLLNSAPIYLINSDYFGAKSQEIGRASCRERV